MDAATGHIVWKAAWANQTKSYGNPFLSGDEQSLFVVANQNIFGLSSVSGEIMWSRHLPGTQFGHSVQINELLCVSTNAAEANVQCVDMEGNVAWSFAGSIQLHLRGPRVDSFRA